MCLPCVSAGRYVCVSSSADNRLARRGYRGRTALHWAARNGHVHVLRWLLKTDVEAGGRRGAEVDAGTADGTTAFCWAVWQGQLEAARFLCDEAGCNPHATNSYGCNAAMWAAQGGHLLVCRYLLQRGVAFDLVNANGQGCLHKAAQRGHVAVCEWLVGGSEGGGSDGGGSEGGGAGPPDDGPGLLAAGNPKAHLHREPNKDEGSRPSDLARCGGHEELARWLAAQEGRRGAAGRSGGAQSSHSG